MKAKPWPIPPLDDNLRVRLAHGARLRAEMKRQIEIGEQPQGYRAAWLQQSAQAIIHLLAARGEAFNAAHQDNAVSVSDFLDAIWSARTVLLGQAQQWAESAERAPSSANAGEPDLRPGRRGGDAETGDTESGRPRIT